MSGHVAAVEADRVSCFAEFQDVNVMVILGFGFLCSFLVRYGFSATGFNLLVAIMATQWALILNGMESWYYRGKISVDLTRFDCTYFHKSKMSAPALCLSPPVCSRKEQKSEHFTTFHLYVGVPSLVVAEMCTASALVSIGAVHGKTNLIQLTLIALLEVSGFILNKWLLQTLLDVSYVDLLFNHHQVL